jgi:hypothetical protein
MLLLPKDKLTSCTNDLFLPVANENATNVDPGTTCSTQKGKKHGNITYLKPETLHFNEGISISFSLKPSIAYADQETM